MAQKATLSIVLIRFRAVVKQTKQNLLAEHGSSTVEFIGLSVVLLIPLIYLVIFLSMVQTATFASDSVARQLSRIYSMQTDPVLREAQAAAVIENASGDYGVEISPDSVQVTCSTVTCPTAGAFLTVQVEVGVDLPAVGSIGLGQNLVKVSSQHSIVVDQSFGILR